MVIVTALCNGLGDRLHDICGLATVATLLQTFGIFAWSMHEFQHIDRLYDISLFDLKSLPVSCITNSTDTRNAIIFENFNSGCSLSPINIYKWLNGRFPIEQIVKVYIECASKLSLVPSLANSVPKSELADYVGIHLRRTDKIVEVTTSDHVFTSKSEDVVLFDRMFSYIEALVKAKETKFFICSDDDKYKSEFIDKLKQLDPNIIVMTSTIHNVPTDLRNKHGSHAIYEMWCLKHCKKVLQNTKYSTYAQIASIMSQNVLHNFSDVHSKGWLLLAWKPCLNLYIQNRPGNTEMKNEINLDEMTNAVSVYIPVTASIHQQPIKKSSNIL